MTFYIFKKLCFFTCCLLFSVASYAEVSTPNYEMPQITDQRNAAVGYVFSYTAVVVTVMNTCKTIPSLSKNPNDAFLSWHQRNNQYFEAAKDWLTYVVSNIKSKNGQEVADAFRKQVIGQAAQTGNTTVKGFFTKDTPTEVCEKWMGLLYNPQSDLINNKSEFNNDLEYLIKVKKEVTDWNATH